MSGSPNKVGLNCEYCGGQSSSNRLYKSKHCHNITQLCFACYSYERKHKRLIPKNQRRLSYRKRKKGSRSKPRKITVKQETDRMPIRFRRERRAKFISIKREIPDPIPAVAHKIRDPSIIFESPPPKAGQQNTFRTPMRKVCTNGGMNKHKKSRISSAKDEVIEVHWESMYPTNFAHRTKNEEKLMDTYYNPLEAFLNEPLPKMFADEQIKTESSGELTFIPSPYYLPTNVMDCS